MVLLRLPGLKITSRQTLQRLAARPQEASAPTAGRISAADLHGRSPYGTAVFRVRERSATARMVVRARRLDG
jgi:hypothetical protein